MAEINIWNLRAEYWGDVEDVKRIDFRNQKVELGESGWMDFNAVTFVVDNNYDLENEISSRVDEKLKAEKEYLRNKLDDVSRKESELKIKVKNVEIKDAVLRELVVKEKQKFEEYVATTINNMNRIIDDVYRQSQVANRNEEMKKPTPDYVKYESKVFDREMMKAIEEGK